LFPAIAEDRVAHICGVPVAYFACLTEEAIESGTLPAGGAALLEHPLTAPLARYLSQRVDALLVINTYGDMQTSLLLDIVHAMRSTQQMSSEDSAPILGTAATVWHPPKVIMDLPNLGLPEKWHGKVDGFVPPSRAAGLHRLTTMHGMVHWYWL
jgi:hypothetical protein